MTEIELYRAQYDFVADPSRFSAFIGGVGSGKTFAGAVKAVKEIADVGGLGLVVAPTYPMLRDATLRTFLSIAKPIVAEFNRTEMRVRCINGAEVLFRSADNPDRLRGPNASWAWVDEAAICPQQTWEIVVGRVREGKYGGRAWFTTTPHGRNWVYELVSTGAISVHRAASTDNPYLPPDFTRSLLDSYTGPFARQEIFGEFITPQGLVFEQFSRDLHVCDQPAGDFIVAGLDFGYTNPTALVVVSIGDHIHVLDELYQRRLTTSDLTPLVQEYTTRYRISSILCDPSEPGIIAELRAAGLSASPARPGTVLDGIRHIQMLLAQRRLTISPRCANLIAELEAYVWNERKDAPVKANDHALDALRYALSASNRRAVLWLE